MTSKIKRLLMIIGLTVSLIITLLATAEANRNDSETASEINRPTSVTHVAVGTGTHWIIQTTYKLLKPLH